MPAWPDGTATREWMRAQSVGSGAGDLAALDETTAVATAVIRSRLIAERLELGGSVVSVGRAGGVVTLGVEPDHGVVVGDVITVTGDPWAGSFVVDAVGPLTLAYASPGTDTPTEAWDGVWATVGRCPAPVALAIKIRAASLFLRRDSPAGIVQVTDDQAIRVSRWDADVDDLLAPYAAGPDPYPDLDVV